jgi:hypothetical protein
MAKARKPAELSPDLVAVKGNAGAPAGSLATQPATPSESKISVLNFKVDKEFRRRFRMRAAQADLQLNELLRQALDAWEEKHQID